MARKTRILFQNKHFVINLLTSEVNNIFSTQFIFTPSLGDLSMLLCWPLQISSPYLHIHINTHTHAQLPVKSSFWWFAGGTHESGHTKSTFGKSEQIDGEQMRHKSGCFKVSKSESERKLMSYD